MILCPYGEDEFCGMDVFVLFCWNGHSEGEMLVKRVRYTFYCEESGLYVRFHGVIFFLGGGHKAIYNPNGGWTRPRNPIKTWTRLSSPRVQSKGASPPNHHYLSAGSVVIPRRSRDSPSSLRRVMFCSSCSVGLSLGLGSTSTETCRISNVLKPLLLRT